MRRRDDGDDYPAVLASPDAIDADGSRWSCVEAWEYGRRAWPHPSWHGGLSAPDEPISPDDF